MGNLFKTGLCDGTSSEEDIFELLNLYNISFTGLRKKRETKEETVDYESILYWINFSLLIVGILLNILVLTIMLSRKQRSSQDLRDVDFNSIYVYDSLSWIFFQSFKSGNSPCNNRHHLRNIEVLWSRWKPTFDIITFRLPICWVSSRSDSQFFDDGFGHFLAISTFHRWLI